MIKYRFFSWIIVLSIVFTAMSICLDDMYANGEVDDLFDQRAEYIAKYPENGGDDFAVVMNSFRSEVRLTVLLYTDIAKTLTFEKVIYGDKSDPYLESAERWLSSYGNYNEEYLKGGYYLTSPEIDKAIKAPVNEYGRIDRSEKSSHLRACIEYFDISKEELIKANKLMQENPDAIREVLNFLSDSEYELARKENGMFCTRPIPDFAIEALYLEDDVVANNLLCQEWSVYFGDHLNRVVTDWEIGVGYLIQVEELATCELTPEWVCSFIENNRNFNNFAELAAARDAQLKAAQTGDGGVTALWVVALALPTLAAVVKVKRKRRI